MKSPTSPGFPSDASPAPRWRFPAVEPGERFLWAWALWVVVGMGSVAWPPLGGLMWLWGGVLLVASAWDLWQAGDPHALRPMRRAPERVWQGAEVNVTLTLLTPRAMRVEIVDALPLQARSVHGGDDPCMRVELPAGRRVELEVPLRFVGLGPATFGRLSVRSLGPLGLWRRRARIPLATTLRVLPPVIDIQRDATQTLHTALRSAASRGRTPADGQEFDGLREYARGDDPRCIDWKASARSGALRIRQYAPERLQEGWVVIDGARALAGELEAPAGTTSPRIPRFDGAIRAGLTLAATALAQGDRIGLLCQGATLRVHVPPAAGHDQLLHFAQALHGEASRPEEFDAAAWTRQIEEDRARHAAIFLFTDVVDRESATQLLYAVRTLGARRRITLFCLRDPTLQSVREEAEARGDAAQRWAVQHVLSHRDAALRALRAAGADVVDLDTREPTRAVVEAYLRSRSARRPGSRGSRWNPGAGEATGAQGARGGGGTEPTSATLSPGSHASRP